MMLMASGTILDIIFIDSNRPASHRWLEAGPEDTTPASEGNEVEVLTGSLNTRDSRCGKMKKCS